MEYIAGILRGLSFSDVLDMMIVGFLVYQCLKYVKGTRSMQLAKGLGIILVAYAISGALDLYTVNWLISKILSIGLIALVVVFQPELRHALEYLGRRGFTTGFSLEREKGYDVASNIVSAVDYFAQRKEGALIIVEKNTMLLDIISSGSIIDAQLSDILLENLFYKGSPLHDGAVVVRGDRIVAAGCVLPLSENPGLSKDLGTRHRAGIGMSEHSDAICIIVSEETGIISVAQNGGLNRFLDLKSLEKILLNNFMDDNSKKRFSPFRTSLPGIIKRKSDEE